MVLKAIVACGVYKSIDGREILKDVSIEVEEGTVMVLAGPNGSGKTTLIRVLLGLYKRDKGRVEVLGVDPLDEARWSKTRTLVGYVPEDASPYERLTGWENLLYMALLYTGGDKNRAVELAERAAEITGLTRGQLAKKAGEYSRGMRRRLLLASALMTTPRLVVLDEPTSGLDVFASYRVKQHIKSLVSKGTTVLVTTHDMKEAEELADSVAFILDGRIRFQGTVEEALREYHAESLEEAFVRAVGERQ